MMNNEWALSLKHFSDRHLIPFDDDEGFQSTVASENPKRCLELMTRISF